MKNIFRLMAVAALASAMLFTACKKDEEDTTTAPQTTDELTLEDKVVVEFTPTSTSALGYAAQTDTLQYCIWKSYLVSDTTWYYINAFKNYDGSSIYFPWVNMRMYEIGGSMSIDYIYYGRFNSYMTALHDTIGAGLYPFASSLCPEWVITNYQSFNISDYQQNCFSFDIKVEMGNLYQVQCKKVDVANIERANVRIRAKKLVFEQEQE